MSNGREDLEKFTDSELLARCIWGEARGEGIEGKLAVAHVVLNRLEAKTYCGRTLKQVILKPWQFSCFNESDPNLAKILRLRTDDPSLAYCQAVADIALLPNRDDPAGGATHYHSPGVKPSWASSERMTPLRRIGNHLFYRESPTRKGKGRTRRTGQPEHDAEVPERKDDQE